MQQGDARRMTCFCLTKNVTTIITVTPRSTAVITITETDIKPSTAATLDVVVVTASVALIRRTNSTVRHRSVSQQVHLLVATHNFL